MMSILDLYEYLKAISDMVLFMDISRIPKSRSTNVTIE